MKTPQHTADELRKAIASAVAQKGNGGAKFVSLDTRVLEWLLDDRDAAPALYQALERIAGDNWSGTDHMDAPEAANTLMRIVAEMQAIACAALSQARGETP